MIGLHTSYWAVMVPAMLLSGVGMGMAMTVTADTVLASVPKDRSGSASAIAETATELGAALGMAILGSVLTAVYRNTLDLPGGLPAPAASAARDSLGAALQAAANLPATVAAQVSEAAREAFVDGMHAALVCSAGLAALVAVLRPGDAAERPQGHRGGRGARPRHRTLTPTFPRIGKSDITLLCW